MLAPQVFGYDEKLKDALAKHCSFSLFFNERPGNSFLIKAGIRLNFRPLTFVLTYFYFQKIARFLDKHEIDQVLIINPEATPEWFLKMVSQKKIKLTIYLWDSIVNKPGSKKLARHADKVWSFDPKDCESYGYHYKPLFYSENFITSQKHQYDLSFIGTLHGDRYLVVNKVLENLYGLKTYKFFYCPSKLMFLFHKYISRKWWSVRFSDVDFEPLKPAEVNSVLASSFAILDVHSPNQSGLTMRTIETLGNGKKMLTTNLNIKEEHFYDETYVKCFDRSNLDQLTPEELEKFVKSKPDKKLDMHSQHIDKWIGSLLDG
ncbi:hypothetical protein PPIS_a4335 [Pseudoalteromonas piscicida]|uniref:Lipopolysaccharide biosynthesis protein n=2 Tax=Pseudoalteromonas piscicida TaxID=43662 RepID=A0ABN5CJQ1_PSEO7|nr:hypothetical protein PPIS_a4335 [Pseudoalteromonas piscicida]